MPAIGPLRTLSGPNLHDIRIASASISCSRPTPSGEAGKGCEEALMWAQGVFGTGIDTALFVAALSLCLVVAWQIGRRLGPPRFRGAVGMLWLIAAVALPVPAYFASGVGLWVGAVLFEEMRLGAEVGAAVGWVLMPSLLCFVALSLLALLLTKRRERNVA